MKQLDPQPAQWLANLLGEPFTASKHVHSHQDEVYKIATTTQLYFLKISASLQAEHDNLTKLASILQVPRVIDFYTTNAADYLLLSALPGKNLVELIGDWSNLAIVETFAQAVRQLHHLNAAQIYPAASPKDVLLHGDMALPNIIISEPGQIGYIDFGQLSFGPPDLDLADALWSLQRNLGPDYGELFLQKYGPVTMTPQIEKALKYRYQAPN